MREKSDRIKAAAADAALKGDTQLGALLYAVAEGTRQVETTPTSTMEILRWSAATAVALKIADERLGTTSVKRGKPLPGPHHDDTRTPDR